VVSKVDNQQEYLPFLGTPSTVWRPIHYLGSKLRLCDQITGLIDELDPSRGAVCDLFAGSGTVSLALAATRRVVASDIQEYSRTICAGLLAEGPVDLSWAARITEQATADHYGHRLSHCLAPLLELEDVAHKTASLDPEPLCHLVESGALLGDGGQSGPLAEAISEVNERIEHAHCADSLRATRYFGGVYFSYKQSLFLDCALKVTGEMPQAYRDCGTAAVLSTASTLVNSIGKQFAQPVKPRSSNGEVKAHLIKQMVRDRTADASRIFGGWVMRYAALPRTPGHRVIRADYREVLDTLEGVSVVYADPPYTRDHYSRFYHVLETLAKRDSPSLSTVSLGGEITASRGGYRDDRHQSPFCIRSQAPAAFAELFAKSRRLDVPLLVSYSPYLDHGHPRMMAVEDIVSLAQQHYSRVEVVNARGLAHSKLNKSELHLNVANTAEVFLLCRC
jgi:adenine-specific DNA-methyltransferase